MQRDKLMVQEELKRTRAERERMEDKLAEAELRKASLEELKEAIKVRFSSFVNFSYDCIRGTQTTRSIKSN